MAGTVSELLIVKLEVDLSEFQAKMDKAASEIEARLSAIEKRQKNLKARMATIKRNQL